MNLDEYLILDLNGRRITLFLTGDKCIFKQRYIQACLFSEIFIAMFGKPVLPSTLSQELLSLKNRTFQ
ncbi:hypothetical protein Lbir_1606 [Legionella birminghamensis]|uniref:Uncharacterized protein n=1 Tax=Legionella birminghamensis TaxID=28083 RepID=A0A378ICB8_9GAMM|nr:hypothetical protein Lbir_1606 [Legionella birminghamensis]STX32412.1 Uncharacterised protein [Legionella birminghamensis]